MNTQKTIRIRTVGFRLGVALGCSVAFLGASFAHGVESIFEELVGHDANERELPFALSIPWLNPDAPDFSGGPLGATWNGPDRPDADKPLDWSGIVFTPGDDLLGIPGNGIPGADLWTPPVPSLSSSFIAPAPGIPDPGSHDLFTSTTPEWLDAGPVHDNSFAVPTSGGAIPGPAGIALLVLGGLVPRRSRRR